MKKNNTKELKTERRIFNDERKVDFGKMFAEIPTPAPHGSIEMIEVDRLVQTHNKFTSYQQMDGDEFLRLVKSIEKNWLIYPVIAWEIDDGLMILSGNERKRAFEFLKEKSSNNKYDMIPTVIYKAKDLNEEQAKEIIVDSNWHKNNKCMR